MRQESGPFHQGYLHDVRVVELADEQAEYAGKLLAGLGADVVKIEHPQSEHSGGNSTRSIGPFLNDQQHPDRSLYFWHYNFGKRGLTLDLTTERDRGRFLELVREADVFLESTPRGYLASQGITYERLSAVNPALIWSRVMPFGDDGPWAGYKASDLVHLALGGVMMCTGYDPHPLTKEYETPPIAPQMFQAYHIAGQHAVIAAIGALLHQRATGRGQQMMTAVHQAVSCNTELDVPAWIYQRQPLYRQTCRHAMATQIPRTICTTKDGRWVMARMVAGVASQFDKLVVLLDRYGHAEDLTDPKYRDPQYRAQPMADQHIHDVTHRFLSKFLFEGPWREGQEHSQLWAPLRRPEENLRDPHWRARRTFQEVEHPELGKRFTYVGAPWVDEQVPWRTSPRAPLLGEDNGARWERPGGPRKFGGDRGIVQMSALRKPFAINNLRVIDFSWWLASGGGPRFLSALGAEVIKVEWKGRWDLRYGANPMPEGGRAERDAATKPCPPKSRGIPGKTSPNRSGSFNDTNPGKRSISLNMQHPKARAVLERLIRSGDVVCEGFSPGVMASWGFTYEVMRAINPSIIYVQQSGMGQRGTYGKFRATGTVANSLAGLSEMSGLPEPFPPTGIGYSYLDWFGAYNFATAIIAAAYRRETTGQGTHIDASQIESGIYLNGSAILNYSANGKRWQRSGNRSPWKLAAPSGAYRCRGNDRWIAITGHTEDEWRALLRVLGEPAWGRDPRFATLRDRQAHQDALDEAMNGATASHDAFELMARLQQAGVPAGVCQTAEDRCDRDPQLRHLRWLTELLQRESGLWPVKEFPVHLSETPPYMGGPVNRASPDYMEDNGYVYRDLLGMTRAEFEALRAEDVL